MKLISSILTGMLFLGIASLGYSQSLADLAKKEKERRQAVKAGVKVLTNDHAAKFDGAPITLGTPPPAAPDSVGAAKTGAGTEKPAAEGDAAAAAVKEKPASDEPVDFLGRPESFWKQTFADARQKVKDLENEANVLVLKLNDLQNTFYKESDGFKQQEIQREIQKTIYLVDVNRDNIAKAKTSLADLETEARKTGALPGWIR